MKASELARRHRVDDGAGFRLADVNPADTGGLDTGSGEAKEFVQDNLKDLRQLQERLYAEGRSAVLMVFQAMDAGGKDSAIQHVMSGINPQGCDVRAFKQPGSVELAHDFLWRHQLVLPARGRIGIFNRSHYEEVLVVRVHPEILRARNIPDELLDGDIWERRFESIRAFERHLADSGTTVLKFFLHISPEEQARRFLDRIDEPDKNWKFSFGDLAERKLWDRYMEAYEDAIRNTARPHAPWYVVPSDDKWYSRLVISAALEDALLRIDPQFPEVDDDERRRMRECRDELARGLDGAPKDDRKRDKDGKKGRKGDKGGKKGDKGDG